MQGIRTRSLILDPCECTDGEATKHGRDAGKLDDELGEEAGEGGIANNYGVVKSVA